MNSVASRRRFLKIAIGMLSGAGLLFQPLLRGVLLVCAGAERIILPRGTQPGSLKDKNPAELDTRNLEIMPLDGFQTMGLTDHQTPLHRWRLRLTGHVERPIDLSYAQIQQLPSVERNVLLICPGFFANHGRWKGITMEALLRRAGMKEGVTQVTFYGPEGPYEKLQTFPIRDVLSDKVFLAYEVNGTPLPLRHGYPLRLVAEGYFGFDWIKYVYKVNLDRVEKETSGQEGS